MSKHGLTAVIIVGAGMSGLTAGACIQGGAQVMGDSEYGLAVGRAADLVVVDGETHVEAVIERPPRWLVLKGGRVVARRGECLV